MRQTSLLCSVERATHARRPVHIGRILRSLLTMLFVASLSASQSCAITPETTDRNFTTPEDSLSRMQQAFAGDNVMDFLSTLSEETLAKYETKILAAWSEVREQLYFLQHDLHVVEVRPHDPHHADARATSDYVFPREGRIAQRLRARIVVDGKTYEEDFLFVEETDEAPANTTGSPYVRVRDETIPRIHHPTPDRYTVAGPDEAARTHWRMVYPYFEFQSRSALARDLMEKMDK